MSTTDTALDPIAVGDELRIAADRAAKLLEKLGETNDSMKSAALGILPDGTPVEDVLADLRDAKAELANLRSALRTIAFHANRKASERAAAIVAIKQITHGL